VTAGHRPDWLVVVTGTGTEVGKTWWSAAVLRGLRARDVAVAARKPVQSYAPTDPIAALDASVLAAATGERPEAVCPTHRWLAEPMAPPIAAARLGLDPFRVADLVDELAWPAGTEVGLVEGAGGLRSPLADDGDTRTLVQVLRPDAVLVVADAALGVIHSARLVMGSLANRTVTVALNRFDPTDPVHVESRDWLERRDGIDVVTDPAALVDRWA
jgi:dethiobiotin synthetase